MYIPVWRVFWVICEYTCMYHYKICDEYSQMYLYKIYDEIPACITTRYVMNVSLQDMWWMYHYKICDEYTCMYLYKICDECTQMYLYKICDEYTCMYLYKIYDADKSSKSSKSQVGQLISEVMWSSTLHVKCIFVCLYKYTLIIFLIISHWPYFTNTCCWCCHTVIHFAAVLAIPEGDSSSTDV